MDTTNRDHEWAHQAVHEWAHQAVRALLLAAMRRAADLLGWIDDLYGCGE